jgi:hypothetical protein
MVFALSRPRATAAGFFFGVISTCSGWRALVHHKFPAARTDALGEFTIHFAAISVSNDLPTDRGNGVSRGSDPFFPDAEINRESLGFAGCDPSANFLAGFARSQIGDTV